jgi:predicted Holliday junction resolvase-like endonuclease
MNWKAFTTCVIIIIIIIIITIILIILILICQVRALPNMDKPQSRKFYLEITVPGKRVYILRTASEDDREAWVKVLHQVWSIADHDHDHVDDDDDDDDDDDEAHRMTWSSI